MLQSLPNIYRETISHEVYPNRKVFPWHQDQRSLTRLHCTKHSSSPQKCRHGSSVSKRQPLWYPVLSCTKPHKTNETPWISVFDYQSTGIPKVGPAPTLWLNCVWRHEGAAGLRQCIKSRQLAGAGFSTPGQWCISTGDQPVQIWTSSQRSYFKTGKMWSEQTSQMT